MAADDDDISDEDAEDFAKLDDETRKRIEKFNRWQAKQKDPARSANPSNNSRAPANGSDYNPTLSELETLVATPGRRSILQSLLGQAEALTKLPKEAEKGGRKLLSDAKKRFL